MLAVAARLLFFEDGDSVDDFGLNLGDAVVELGLFAAGRLVLLIHKIEILRIESSILLHAKYSPLEPYNKCFPVVYFGFAWKRKRFQPFRPFLYIYSFSLAIKIAK